MKTSLFKHLAPLCAAICLLAACNNNTDLDKASPQDNLADYTIILYGTTGSLLYDIISTDEALRNSIAQVRATTHTPKVNFTALVRYNPEVPGIGVTSYEWLPSTASPTGAYLFEQNNVRPIDHPMTKPENITSYINEQVSKYPAHKYILVLWGESGGFDREDAYTRTCLENYLYADTTGNTIIYEDLPLFDLEDALAATTLVQSGGKFEAIYTDMCTMGSIECAYQLKPYTHLYMGHAHHVPFYRGNYGALINALAACNQNTEAAMAQYTQAVANEWKTQDVTSDCAIFCYHTNRLSAAVEAFAPISAKMASHIGHIEKEEERSEYLFDLIGKSYNYDDPAYPYGDYCPYYDWADMVRHAQYEGKDQAQEKQFFDALTQAQVAYGDIRNTSCTLAPEQKFGLSICVFGGGTYKKPSMDFDEEEGLKPNYSLTYANNYHHLAFDLATNWHKFLATEMLDENEIVNAKWIDFDPPLPALNYAYKQYSPFGIVEYTHTFLFNDDKRCIAAQCAISFSTSQAYVYFLPFLWETYGEDNVDASQNSLCAVAETTHIYEGMDRDQIKASFEAQ